MCPETPALGMRSAGSLCGRDQPTEEYFTLPDTFSKNKVSHTLILENEVSR